MRLLLATALGSIFIIATGPAFADWRSTTWGMTPDQVVAAVEGAERADGKGEATTYGETDTYYASVLAPVAWGSTTGETDFLFKERTGLQKIDVGFDTKAGCDALLAGLNAEFGAENSSKSGIEGADFVIWKDAAKTVDHVQYMRFTLGPARCSATISNRVVEEASPAADVSTLTPEPEAGTDAEGNVTIGGWTIEEEKSAFDDSTSIFAFIDPPEVRGSGVGAHELSLMVRCTENTTNVLFLTSMFMAGDRAEVTYRIDTQDAVVLPMSISSSYKATGFWTGSSAIPFIRSIYAAEKLAVRVSDDTTVEGVFDLTGIRTVAERVAEACKWEITP